MISYIENKDPVRVIKNAVLDDISPLQKGTEFEYWQGYTDMEPNGVRKDVFQTVSSLEKSGRILVYQSKLEDDRYSYKAKVL